MMSISDALLQLWDSQQNYFVSSGSLSTWAWIAGSIIAYVVALKINRIGKGSPLLHPIIIASLLIAFTMWLTNFSVFDYREHARPLQWLLGPATVALALPMFNQWKAIKHLGWRLIVAVAIGGVVAPVLAWACVFATNAPLAIQMTMLTKSITSPLAMETSRIIGGVGDLAAVFVIITGIIGAMVVPGIFKLFAVHDQRAQGVALGSVCHAVGTAKAIQMDELTGAMATIGLCVNGIMTALVLPLLFS